MTSAAPIPPITGTVTLAVPVERAFEVFTGSVNVWWLNSRVPQDVYSFCTKASHSARDRSTG